MSEWVSLGVFGKRKNTLIEWNRKRLNECEMIALQCDYCNWGHLDKIEQLESNNTLLHFEKVGYTLFDSFLSLEKLMDMSERVAFAYETVVLV